MTVAEVGNFQAGFYQRWNERIFRGVLGDFGLKPETRVKHLSRGMASGDFFFAFLAFFAAKPFQRF